MKIDLDLDNTNTHCHHNVCQMYYSNCGAESSCSKWVVSRDHDNSTARLEKAYQQFGMVGVGLAIYNECMHVVSLNMIGSPV